MANKSEARQKKILVTGFDPFDGQKVNPASQAVFKLPDEISGAAVIKLEVPTVFGRAAQVVREAIIKEQIGRETYYHVGSRQFELAEVKLLIDAIQSSKFITRAKSRELIAKIKIFVSD